MAVDLAYTEAGSGPPVVLLHGFPLSSAMWEPARTLLSDRWRIITPDLRGFGGSPVGSAEPSVEVMADDVVRLLDRLQLERVVLGGLSMGGYVVMAMLRKHADRVSAVLLMDTKASADSAEARGNRTRMAQRVLAEGQDVLRPMVDTLLGPTTLRDAPPVVAKLQRWLDETRPDGVSWAQYAMAGRPDSMDTLRAVHVPAAVLLGEEDAIASHDDALAMSSAFEPPAVVYVVPGAGHLSIVEQPDRTARAMRDALVHMERS